MEVQRALGSDIAMGFDECTRADVTPEQLEQAVRRTSLWARAQPGGARARPASWCSASCRAATDMRMRERSAGEIVATGFDGYAIGGLSVGEERSAMLSTVAGTTAMLPDDRPRYFMGIGDPEGLLT